jgi:uncharacterized protein
MTEFTPLQSLIGGALIGAAAVLLMALHGRIAGITGILGGLLPPGRAPDRGWRIAFLAGAVASLLAYRGVVGRMVEFASPASLPALLIGGVLVGIGVTFGAGCTSGHGVCGLARFSVRSLAAVLTFMAAAATTVFVSRHILGV